jgi:hypothetical protein
MKTENRNNWMTWAIVVLAIMNISTIVTILYHYEAGKQEPVQTLTQQKSNTGSEKFSGRFFASQLSFNDEQMKKFRNINHDFRLQAHNITLDLAEKRQHMLIEMSASQSDTSRLNNLCDSIGYLHSKLKKSTYQYYLNIKSFCNGEQQVKLEQLVGEIFLNDGNMGLRGQQGKRGRMHRYNQQ